jgi:hypothetical protein
MRNDVGTYHEERHLDVALLQNVEQPGGVTRTWAVVKSHGDKRTINVTGAVGCRSGEGRSGRCRGSGALGLCGNGCQNR